MARARVVLKEQAGSPKSIDTRGFHFEGSTAHVVSKDEDILAFTYDPMFIVELLDGEPTPPPKSSPEASKLEDEDDDSDLDEEDDEKTLERDDLIKLTKKQLAELAKERGIKGVDAQMNKDEILSRILNADKE